MITSNPTSGPSLLSIGAVSRIYGVHQNTLRHATNSGTLKTYRAFGSSHRRFRLEDVEAWLGLDEAKDTEESTKERHVLVVCRVSSFEQARNRSKTNPDGKSDLDRQIARCLAYCDTELPGVKRTCNVRKAVSGLSLDHPKFLELLLNIIEGKYTDLVCTHLERVCRSGKDMIRALCKQYNVKIHVIEEEEEEKTLMETLTDDIISYMTSVTAKVHSQRSAKYSRVTPSSEQLQKMFRLRKFRNYTYAQIAHYMNFRNELSENGKKFSKSVCRRLLLQHGKELSAIVQPTDEDKDSLQVFFSKVTETEKPKYDTFAIYEAYVAFCKRQHLPAKSKANLQKELLARMYNRTRDGRNNSKRRQIYHIELPSN
jgi:excisionase family DNA binding protein